MSSARLFVRETALRDCWRDFFKPIVGQVLFVPKVQQSEIEVEHVIKRSQVKASLNVLDLACGVGRHSLVFATRGFKVTGLDYSKPFLREAKKAARKARREIRFVHGDMKNLKSYFIANEFGLVVSLFNSFGYFHTRRDDFKMLKAVHRVLRPGGAFILNTLNGAGVAKRLKKPISFGYEPLPNVFMIDAPRYDVAKRQTFSKWTIIDARRAKTRIFRGSFSQNVYSHAELKRLLTAAGFGIEATSGVLAGGHFNRRESWQQTIMARKRWGIAQNRRLSQP
jgi:ubiquinone/menaquinone biosynthesis C-methylase UbiE